MTMYEICLLHARSDRALRAKIAALLGESNITMMEWLLLGVVSDAQAKGMTMSEIAQALHVTLPQVTALVNKLLPLKLIKQKSASNDRRSRIVSLTSKGEVVLEDSKRMLNDAKDEVYGDVGSSEIDAYTQVLSRLSVAA